MSKVFDLSRFRNGGYSRSQYNRQLRRLADEGKSVVCIERAVRDSLENLAGEGRKSFVIYGEPQSGKTEMMICLTAKLLDEGRRFILHLLNDSVDLLSQNLGRFKNSGLAPSARNYSEILDPAIDVGKNIYVIFCKKNASDLRKLIRKIGQLRDIVVIDDEADFASPNGRVNKGEKTKINELISKVLGEQGDYIGVTATPARLDLNNTFDNDSKLWVNFPAHEQYTGHGVFFPFDVETAAEILRFQLTLLPEKGDDPKYAREALFRFLVSVAFLNLSNNDAEENYSILIHTSGKKVDHKTDWGTIQEALAGLANQDSRTFEPYVREIWGISQARYPDADPDLLTDYVVANISRNSVVMLNSDSDFRQNVDAATRPTSLFTIVIGGNIVSRGVTFENLLSMYFTRDVKHKIQQDTYIQRARMFGSRGRYLEFFELTIPRTLYADWHRCFVFHRLSLASINSGKGSPVWLSDSRISAVASASIDRSTVDIDRGEMAFALFDYTAEVAALDSIQIANDEKLAMLAKLVGDDAFPEYLWRFIRKTSLRLEVELEFLPTAGLYPGMTPEEKAAITRKKGMMGATQTAGQARHFLRIYRNDAGKARLYYKFSGSVKFLKNLR